MTKSQNTKNEQQKDLCITSGQLTEQWKKSELPGGYYYVKNEFNNIFPSDYSESYDSINDAVIKDFFTEVSEITEVIAKVPSYEEWQLMQDDNKRLKHDVGNLGYRIKNQRKEIERQISQNAELKKYIMILKNKLIQCKTELEEWVNKVIAEVVR